MAYKRHGEQFDRGNDVNTYTAGAAITDHYCVYQSAENTVQHAQYGTQLAVGIALDSYDSGDTFVEIIKRGRIKFIANGAISVGDPLTVGTTAGRMRKAYQGETVYGVALKAASTAGDECLGEFNFPGASFTGEVVVLATSQTIDGSVTLPGGAGDYAVTLYVEETAGNAITGGLNVGTTATGQEIAAALTVAGSGKYKYTPEDMATGWITLTAGDSVYFSDETSWNSASVDMEFHFKLMHI